MVPSQGVKEAAEADVHLLTEALTAIKQIECKTLPGANHGNCLCCWQKISNNSLRVLTSVRQLLLAICRLGRMKHTLPYCMIC